MRIGFDAKRLYNNFTGLGNYSRTLVCNLLTQFPDDELFLYTPKSKLDHIDGATTKMPSKCKRTWRSWGVKRDLIADRVQIYHGLSHDLPFAIHKTGIKTVVTIHDVCYKTFPGMFPLVERMIYDIKYKYSCRKSDHIIAISESTKRDIIRYMKVDPSKISVVYQSINPIFYQRQSNPRNTIDHLGVPNKYILYVGSINSRKNLLGIVKAYSLMSQQDRLPLVVIGNGGSYKAEVLKYVEENDLHKYIIIFDSVQDLRILQAFYQSATLFVYPSFYEGFGLPVTEALLSGVPTITSSVSSLPEAGGDAAMYVDPTNIEELACSITTLLHDEKLRCEMIEKGLTYAHSKFNPELLTKQVHNIYRELCNSIK